MQQRMGQRVWQIRTSAAPDGLLSAAPRCEYPSARHVAPVAQLDRALPSEGRGHRFESCRVRHLRTKPRTCAAETSCSNLSTSRQHQKSGGSLIIQFSSSFCMEHQLFQSLRAILHLPSRARVSTAEFFGRRHWCANMAWEPGQSRLRLPTSTRSGNRLWCLGKRLRSRLSNHAPT
jgi:hypothetical protein